MARTVKFLGTLLFCGLAYSLFKGFTGEGGSGLEDFADALIYSSLVLFFASLVIVVLNVRNLKDHWPAFIFLLIGFPLTLGFVRAKIEQAEYDRDPDLSVKYPLPVSRDQYLFDSANIQLAINSLITLNNNQYGGPDVLYGVIDTIIYSQKGDKVFVSYMKQFEPNDMGNDLDAAYLGAAKRDSVFWQLRSVGYQMGGSFHDAATLRKEVRKFYFNQFSLLDKDSANENYFWNIVR